MKYNYESDVKSDATRNNNVPFKRAVLETNSEQTSTVALGRTVLSHLRV